MLARPATAATVVAVFFALGAMVQFIQPDNPADADAPGTVEPLDASLGADIPAEMVETVIVPPVPEVDVRAIDAMVIVITRLESLIESGHAQCAALGEPRYKLDVRSLVANEQIERWNDFAVEWGDAVSLAYSRMPSPPPFGADPNIVLGYQTITTAVQELRLVPVGAGSWPTPFAHEWESRFASAQAALRNARALLGR